VLAARLHPDGGLYIIERVKRGVYALCRLASWVGEGELRVAAKGQRLSDTASKLEINNDRDTYSGDWRELARLDANLFDQDSALKDKIKKLDVSLAFGPIVSPGLAASAYEDPSRLGQNVEHDLPEGIIPAFHDSPEPHTDILETAAQTAGEIRDSLREQYLEALYISKVIKVLHYCPRMDFHANIKQDLCCLLRQRTPHPVSSCLPIF
jgi:DNA replication regulator SLD3